MDKRRLLRKTPNNSKVLNPHKNLIRHQITSFSKVKHGHHYGGVRNRGQVSCVFVEMPHYVP